MQVLLFDRGNHLKPTARQSRKKKSSGKREELIQDLVRVQQRFPKVTLTRNFYRGHARFVDAAWQKHFAKFSEFTKAAGLEKPAEAAPPPKPELLPEERFAASAEVRRLKAELSDVAERLSRHLKLDSFVEKLLSQPLGEAPAWTHEAKAGQKFVTPTAFLSDTHFGEKVFPEQIEYINGYDRPIALARLQNFFHNTVVIAKQYLSGVQYPGIVMPMGGDIFSGDIHEELDRTNEGTIQEEILFWIDPVVSGIKMLADEFGQVFIPAVPGNHPRGTKKPVHKMRVPNNFDWLFCCFLKKIIDDTPYKSKVTWRISASADCDYSIYNTRYRLSHGDQFRGGSGIAGMLSPLMIGDARKRKRAQKAEKPYDYLVLGHWHQRAHFKGILVNGSLKGADEYAYDNNFDLEPPEQSFWITDPNHGLTIEAPIHVLGDDEPWMSQRELHSTLAFRM